MKIRVKENAMKGNELVKLKDAIDAHCMIVCKRYPTEMCAMECPDEAVFRHLEDERAKIVRTIRTMIYVTDTADLYSCGVRNGMRWCGALLDDEDPRFEDASQYPAMSERVRPKGKWVGADTQCGIACSVCGVAVDDFCHSTDYIDLDYNPNFCPNCGADLRGVD